MFDLLNFSEAAESIWGNAMEAWLSIYQDYSWKQFEQYQTAKEFDGCVSSKTHGVQMSFMTSGDPSQHYTGMQEVDTACLNHCMLVSLS